TLNIRHSIELLIHEGDANPIPLFVVALLVFAGAMGKSAQFPLHVWLPDAMEGPTPVSALIHAATMVAAGVYLMARVTPLLDQTPQLAAWVLAIGALTAFLAATMALVERDVKRILAFSTISQLGYMMAAVGAAGTVAAVYHLSTHAFFKALLFLAAGSVIHALRTNDIFQMGRLARRMPLTTTYFLIGGLALSGVPPLSGFFSKDAILVDLLHDGRRFAFWLLVVTAGLTSFYMGRAFFVIFFGGRDGAGHAHESPAVMTVPMGVLALLALGGGLFGSTIAELIEHSISSGAGRAERSHSLFVPLVKTAVAVAGIVLAWLGYQARAFEPAALARRFAPITRLLERRYYVDDLLYALYRALYLGAGAVVGWFDRYIVDGLVNLVSWIGWRLAARARGVQTGRAQDALYAIAVGFLLLALLALGRW
ncbi:MAG TPA: NADH-quinone oxidoreductase subunit L, partial [Candidatus Polarisedimenticolaceae bacterium]|nr:NADH-quinone oxidoreductase subunit L [Candidatus Polarisedimenticolaceae bacterium]